MITDLFPATLFTQLDKLSRFFVWRRRPLHESIATALQSADARHHAVNQAHQHTLARLEALIQSHAQLTEQQASTTAELDSTRQALLDARHSLEKLQTKLRQDQEQAKLRFDALSTQHSLLGQERDQLEAARLTLEQTLEVTRVELLASTEATESLQQSLARHQQTNAELAERFQALQQRHGDTWTRFELISRLLAARPQESAGLARFRELLATDYMAFAESESSLAAEAKALTLLQSIEQELALLVSFPDVRKRTIVGIVGGFSSGKSEFINSFIHDPQVRLAVGLKPVTAIPSYVLATDERMIRGYSASGGHINLDVDFYKNVSHAFINSFSFDLKSLMPFMCVGVQMRPECLAISASLTPPATTHPQPQPSTVRGTDEPPYNSPNKRNRLFGLSGLIPMAPCQTQIWSSSSILVWKGARSTSCSPRQTLRPKRTSTTSSKRCKTASMMKAYRLKASVLTAQPCAKRSPIARYRC
jgi:predicted  nucleic acid-binding Zn-ribbon protein